LFQKNSQVHVESELNHKLVGKMYMRQSVLYRAFKFCRLLLDPIVSKI
jgi:hypothetical protein